MYVAGVLMQLCCGALMWLGQPGQGGCSIVITELKGHYFFVFPPLHKGLH